MVIVNIVRINYSKVSFIVLILKLYMDLYKFIRLNELGLK